MMKHFYERYILRASVGTIAAVLICTVILAAAVPQIWYSLNVPVGGFIQDHNVSQASCVETNSSGVYTYPTCPPTPYPTPTAAFQNLVCTGAAVCSPSAGPTPAIFVATPSPAPVSTPSPVASNGMSVSGSYPYTLAVDNCAQAICRVKLAIGLGFQSGTVATATVFPTQPVVAYSSGQITGLRAACASVDNGTTVIELYKDGSGVNSLTLGTSTVSTVTFGGPVNIAAGDYLTMAITTAGTAQNCGFIAEGYQNIQ